MCLQRAYSVKANCYLPPSFIVLYRLLEDGTLESHKLLDRWSMCEGESMANSEHLAILKQGAQVWNKWRAEYPQEAIDLRSVNLSNTDLSGADFSRTNLRGADFRGAD